eukprot:COSAG05_NODE_538_length_8854_cov_306.308738_18_plen_169_part_00
MGFAASVQCGAGPQVGGKVKALDAKGLKVLPPSPDPSWMPLQHPWGTQVGDTRVLTPRKNAGPLPPVPDHLRRLQGTPRARAAWNRCFTFQREITVLLCVSVRKATRLARVLDFLHTHPHTVRYAYARHAAAAPAPMPALFRTVKAEPGNPVLYPTHPRIPTGPRSDR